MNELIFGKEGSKFLVKQNIPLDNLIEGKSVKKEYEVVLYNVVAPLYKFPELGFDSWIRDRNFGIVKLLPESKQKGTILLKDTLDIVVGGGGGAALGYLIGNVPGAVIGAIAGGACSKIITRWEDLKRSLLKEYYKERGTKRVEVIKGTNLSSDSLGIISIDDNFTLFFGIYSYTSRFTTQKNRKIHEEAVIQLRDLINTERGVIQSEVEKVFHKEGIIGGGEASSERVQELKDIGGLLIGFYSVFGEETGLIYLKNIIEIDSNYEENTKSIHTKNSLNIGNIRVKIGKKGGKSKKEILSQIKTSLYQKNFFLENILTIDLRDIGNKKKEEIVRKYPAPERLQYLMEEFPIYFSVLDKSTQIKFYGTFNINTQSLNLTEGRYFNTHDKTIVKI